MTNTDNTHLEKEQEERKEKDKKKYRLYKFRATLLFGFSFAIFLAIFAYLIDTDSSKYPTTYVICLSGCVLGWLVGIITTPYDHIDENKTSKFSKLIGTFISGYFLSKFDKVVGDRLTNHLSSFMATRFLLFVSYFALAWIMTYVFRLYFTELNEESTEKTKSKATKPKDNTIL